MKILTWLLTFVFLMILAVVWRTRDDTIYTQGFSEAKFNSIRVGMPKAEVIQVLGEPLSIQPAPGYIYWTYPHNEPGSLPSPENNAHAVPSSTTFHADLQGKIIAVYGDYGEMLGHPLADVRKRFGDPAVFTEPNRNLYWYSKIKGIKGQYVRFIVINDTGLVGSISAGRIGYYMGADGERPANFLEWLEWYL